MNPSTYNPDARNLTDEIRNVSQELAGASDAALGNIDPSKASGQAILAVRDAAQAPMSRQVAKFKQFVEDIGREMCIRDRLYTLQNLQGARGRLYALAPILV